MFEAIAGSMFAVTASARDPEKGPTNSTVAPTRAGEMCLTASSSGIENMKASSASVVSATLARIASHCLFIADPRQFGYGRPDGLGRERLVDELTPFSTSFSIRV